MQKYLEKTGDIRFEKIFNQRLGFLLLKDFAENVSETSCPQIKFYEVEMALDGLLHRIFP